MNVDSMRKIDRWAGVPLCFVMSIIIWISTRIRFIEKRKPDLSRVLFIELSEMGSAIIVDPAMRRLREAGGSELYFAIFEENYKSLEILQTVSEENTFKMRSSGLFVLAIDVFRFMIWCRRNKINTVIDLELFSRFTALLCALSGARSRVGYASHHDEGLYRGNLINFPVRYNPHVHVSVNFMSLVNTTLGKHDNPYATTAVKPEELKLARVNVDENKIDGVKQKIHDLYPRWKGERLVLLNVNASDLLPQRRWLPENFAAVARHLLVEFDDVLLVATGAPKEREYVGNVVEMVAAERFVNSAGIFKFEELVSLYSISAMMLTNDSGPAHFAAVTNLKVFVIFGPETPALYLPLGNAEPFYLGLPCSPCVSAANHRKTSCTTRPCITGISPEWIKSRVTEYLKTGG
ncbi:MAG: glycosyltransferase family 9 protein [Cytophagales bacterium]|nr:glycosyltransferase family 9 protein [Cytophagales bacterium]